MNSKTDEYDSMNHEMNSDSLKLGDNDDIRDVIDQNDILSECRFHNPVVIEFFTKPQTILKVIDLIINAPVVTLPIKLQYKYAHFATELFLLQCEPILRAFIDDRINLEIIYNFLQSKANISFITIGQIRSIFCNIAQFNRDFFINFIKEKNDFINVIISHLDKISTIDLVFDLIKVYEGQLDCYENEFLSFIINKNIILQTLNYYSESENEDVRFICIQFLSGLLLFSRISLTHITYSNLSLTKFRIDLNRCISDLESDWFINSILEVGFKENYDDYHLVPALFFIRTLLDSTINVESGLQIPLLIKETSIDDILFNTGNDGDTMKNKNLIDNVLSCLSPYIDKICERILPIETKIDLTHYGIERLFFLRNLTFFLHQGLSSYLRRKSQISNECSLRRNSFSNTTTDLDSQCVSIKQLLYRLIEFRFLPRIIEQMFQYPWNSFLHASVENLIEIIVDISSSILDQSKTDINFNDKTYLNVEENNNSRKRNDNLDVYLGRLLKQILVDGNLLKRIVEEWDKNKTIVSQGGQNAGYTGNLRNLCNLLQTNIVQRYFNKTQTNNANPMYDGEREKDFTSDPFLTIIHSINNLDSILKEWNNLFNGDISAGNELISVSYHILTESELASDQENEIQDEDEDLYGNFIQKIYIDEDAQKDYENYCSEISENNFPRIFGVSEDEFIVVHNRTDFEIDYRLKRINFNKQKNEEFNNSTFEVACNEIIKYQHNDEEIRDKSVKMEFSGNQSLDESSVKDSKMDMEIKSEKENQSDLTIHKDISQKKKRKKSIPIKVLKEVFNATDREKSNFKGESNSSKTSHIIKQKTKPSLLKSSLKLELVKPDEDKLKNDSDEDKYQESEYHQEEINNKYIEKQNQSISNVNILNKNRLYTTRLSHQISQKDGGSQAQWIADAKLDMNLDSDNTFTNGHQSKNIIDKIISPTPEKQEIDESSQTNSQLKGNFNSKKFLKINQALK